MRNKEIPLYIINGFLEAGKTSFINATVAEDYFQVKDITLIISLEEGEVEYNRNYLLKYNTVVEYIDSKEEITAEHLDELAKKHNAGRVILEYNIMWNLPDELPLPSHWVMNQQITIVDCSTFNNYFINNDLKSLFMKMVRGSELIIFNRSNRDSTLKDYMRAIKAVNSNTEVVFEDEEGYPVNVRIDEDLPYDVKADHIELKDEDYGIWFIDVMDDPEKYNGKTVTFRAMVIKPPIGEKDIFVPGRHVMTCCANDIQFLGYVCKSEEAGKLKTKDWVTVTAEIKIEYYEAYKGEGPVLYAKEIKPAKAPKEKLIYFGVTG